MKQFPGIPGAMLATRIMVKEAWLKEHPGEEPPDTEVEIAVVVMAVEERQESLLLPGQAQPTTQQRGWPLIELARVPYYAWRRKMNELFGVTKEANNGETGSDAGISGSIPDTILS